MDSLLFCEHFRAVALLRTGVDRTVIPHLPPMEYIGWLERFDTWFKRRVIDGQRLTFLYNRSVSILALDLDSDESYISSITAAARTLGLAVLLQIRVEECIRKREVFQALCGNHTVATLFLDGSMLRHIDDKGVVAEIGLWAKRSGIAMLLFGSFEDWRDTGLLGSPELNSGTFSLIPAPAPVTGAMLDTGPHRRSLRLLSENSPELKPAWQYDPCSNRFQVTITADGWLYPCQGMVGIPQLCLGHVRDDFADVVQRAELSTLILRGPQVEPIQDAGSRGGLPLVCAAHRRSLVTTSG